MDNASVKALARCLALFQLLYVDTVIETNFMGQAGT
jgi:hypothetical protein